MTEATEPCQYVFPGTSWRCGLTSSHVHQDTRQEANELKRYEKLLKAVRKDSLEE